MTKKLRIMIFVLIIALVASCGDKPPSVDLATPTYSHTVVPPVAPTLAPTVAWDLEETMAIQGNITMEWINVEGFSPDASVTIEIYEAKGGLLRAEPFIIQTDQDGHASCDGFQFELNLKPGMHIVAIDDASGFSRELTLKDISIDSFDTELDKVAGTAPPEVILWINAHDEVRNEGYGMEVAADSNGDWSADFKEEMDVDLNQNMNPQVILFDQDDDATIAELTRRPYIEGNLPLDWISANYFSPDATATIEIYDGEGGSLIGEPYIVDTDWNGVATFEGSLIGIDLQPGMVLVVRDNIVTGLEKSVLLVDLEIEEPDFQTNELKGFGPPDTRLTFELYDHDDGRTYFADVLSEGDGFWYLNFLEEFGVPVLDSESTHIKLYDADGDASVADPFGNPK